MKQDDLTIYPPHKEGAVPIGNGRQLGYAEYGAHDGRPVIWFHGTPGARGQIVPTTRLEADERQIRLIVIERPGYGESTSHRYNAIVEWAHDVERFADAMKLDRFAVCGMSGGGPYALACAHELTNRIVVAAILDGVAPTMGPEAAPMGGGTVLARTLSAFLKYTWQPLGWGSAQAIKLLSPIADPAMIAFLQFLPPDDQVVFAERSARQSYTQDLIDASYAGRMQGLYLDAMLFASPWGFSLRDIETRVHFWQGEDDTIVLLAQAEHMESLTPNSQLEIHRHEGHLGSLAATSEIFDAIIEDWGSWPH